MKANQGGLAQLIATSENVAMLTAATTLRLDQRIVHGDTTGGAFTVTLPPVNEAIGMFFSFRLAAGAVNGMTVADQGGAEDWTDLVLNAAEDRILLFSDGITWHVMTVDTL